MAPRMARAKTGRRVARRMSSKSGPRVARVRTVPRVALARRMSSKSEPRVARVRTVPCVALAQATPRVARPERRAAIQSPAGGKDLRQQWCWAQEKRGPARKGRREDLQGTEVTSQWGWAPS